jgi:hypothetical protein
MKKFILCFLFLIFLLSTNTKLIAQTYVGGNISTNTSWDTTGSPYILNDDVTILAGVTLSISPGVVVDFPLYYYDIHVNGTLIMSGTIQDSIRFFGSNPDPNHHGGTIIFNSSSATFDYYNRTH